MKIQVNRRRKRISAALTVRALCRILRHSNKIVKIVRKGISKNTKDAVPTRRLSRIVKKVSETTICGLECVNDSPSWTQCTNICTTQRYVRVLGPGYKLLHKAFRGISSSTPKDGKLMKICLPQGSHVTLIVQRESVYSIDLRSSDNGIVVSVDICNPRKINVYIDAFFCYSSREIPTTHWFHQDPSHSRFAYSVFGAIMDVLINAAPSPAQLCFYLCNVATIPWKKDVPFRVRGEELSGLNHTATRTCQGLPGFYESLGFYPTPDVRRLKERTHKNRFRKVQFRLHNQVHQLRRQFKLAGSSVMEMVNYLLSQGVSKMVCHRFEGT